MKNKNLVLSQSSVETIEKHLKRISDLVENVNYLAKPGEENNPAAVLGIIKAQAYFVELEISVTREMAEKEEQAS